MQGVHQINIMSIIIKVDTGFVGGIHEAYPDLSVEEWKGLNDEEKAKYLDEAIHNNIEAYVEDEDTGEVLF